MNLYLTADKVGSPSGGGLVTSEEVRALTSLEDEVFTMDQGFLAFENTREPINVGDPWYWDQLALRWLERNPIKWELCHLYSGTFTESTRWLKSRGTKISYTCAAHSIEVSRREHEKVGINFVQTYPHLCDPVLWRKYAMGYFTADVLIAPSSYSAATLSSQAANLGVHCPRIEIIPHGCHLPEKVAPLPKTFVCGYAGAVGQDKGLIYLLQAWKQLNYKDALLVLAGRDTDSESFKQYVLQMGGGNIHFGGWYEDLGDFYNSLYCYIQPSATEGFGCEVVEALSYGRPVICSKGAGASGVVVREYDPPGLVVEACSVDALAEAIKFMKECQQSCWNTCQNCRPNKDGHWNMCSWQGSALDVASEHSWDKIRARYINLWKELLDVG